MKYLILIFIIYFLNVTLFAQAPDIQWTKTFDSGQLDWGLSVKQTVDGGYIITGSTEANGANNYDVWLIRTDVNGDTMWTKTFGDSLDDSGGSSVQQTTDGGYIIVGSKTTGSFSGRDSDVWLIKTDANGDTLWTKTYGNTPRDAGSSVQQTSDGGFIIAGYTVGHNSIDVLLIKTNVVGDTLWTKTFGDSLYDNGHSVQQTSDGGYIITGIKNGKDGNPGIIDRDLWLIKTDNNGDTLWTKTYSDEDSLIRWGNSVQQTTDGGYIITGAIGDSLHRFTNELVSSNLLLVKTDAYGDTLWTKTYYDGGSGHHFDIGHSVQQTGDGGYIIIGSHFWLIKTDASGNILWTLDPGGGGVGYSVCQTSDGGYVVAGTKDLDVLLIKIAPDVTSIGENPQASVNGFQLQQNYPNPFNPVTTINYSLPIKSQVELVIYNTLGEKVKQLVNGEKEAGSYSVKLNAIGLSSGVYLYKLQVGEFVETKKMVLVK